MEHAHLRDLAAPTRAATSHTPQRADPGLLRLIDTLAHVPVLLLGRRGDVLARNALLCAVLGRPVEPGSSFVRFLFQDPIARERIVNWGHFAATSVASLRREAGRHPHDRRLTDLIDELRTADVDVARWWDDHAVRDCASVAKRTPPPARWPSTSRSSPLLTSRTRRSWSVASNRTPRPPACCRSWPAGPAPVTR